MSTVTITRKEYENLVEKKLRYERLVETMREDVFSPPPTLNRRAVLKAFRGTKKYNLDFLKSLENALKRSSYFKA